MTTQENKTEFSTICKDGTTYGMQHMNTLIFDELSKTSCEYFLADVRLKNSEWINEPATFNTAQSMLDLTNLYTNYKST